MEKTGPKSTLPRIKHAPKAPKSGLQHRWPQLMTQRPSVQIRPRNQLDRVKMLSCPSSQCFQRLHSPRTAKSGGCEKSLSVSTSSASISSITVFQEGRSKSVPLYPSSARNSVFSNPMVWANVPTTDAVTPSVSSGSHRRWQAVWISVVHVLSSSVLRESSSHVHRTLGDSLQTMENKKLDRAVS